MEKKQPYVALVQLKSGRTFVQEDNMGLLDSPLQLGPMTVPRIINKFTRGEYRQKHLWLYRGKGIDYWSIPYENIDFTIESPKDEKKISKPGVPKT